MGMPMQHIDRIIRSKNVFTAQDGIDSARELAIAIAATASSQSVRPMT